MSFVEDYFCTNCNNVGPLNTNLRCSTCGSDAVVLVVNRLPNESMAKWAVRVVDNYIVPKGAK